VTGTPASPPIRVAIEANAPRSRTTRFEPVAADIGAAGEDREQIRAVGSGGAHDGNDRDAGPKLGSELLDGAHDLLVQWGGRAEHRPTERRDRDSIIGQHLPQGRIHLANRLTRQDAAIDRGARALRERVDGVSALDLRDNASGAQLVLLLIVQQGLGAEQSDN
jgi:hypothetical protein